jgi:SMODS-associated and fused to various effectors sensor domain
MESDMARKDQVAHGEIPSQTERGSPVVRVPRGKLNRDSERLLIARAAGQCEFRGCNEFLYVHRLTGELGNFAENAHVVAFQQGGPRGDVPDRPADIDNVDNLMLLCRRDHKLIDDNPRRYTVEELNAHKREHESRIKRATATGPSMQTTVLQFTAKIGEFKPTISRAEIAAALLPRYPADWVCNIDLNTLGGESPGSMYELACRRIDQEVAKLHATSGDLERTQHLSIFALAPIPLLAKLGATIGNKIDTDFFQCHRNKAERWSWFEGETAVKYRVTVLRLGTDPDKVALLLALSGPITPASLPMAIDKSFTLYEIGLADRVPTPTFLRQREDLEAFREIYRTLLSRVRGEHPHMRQLHLFPAVPAPIAVVCGFDLLPKVDPVLIIYDNIKEEGGFVDRLKVNS